MKTTLPSTELFGSSKIQINYQRPHFNEMYHVTCAENANEILRKYVNSSELDVRESFWVMLLTNANRVLALSQVAIGTTRGVPMNQKYIFQLALLTNASAIIIAHNHPSGNLTISQSDIKETKKAKRLADAMDITLLDHLIITSESFVSMAQEDKM